MRYLTGHHECAGGMLRGVADGMRDSQMTSTLSILYIADVILGEDSAFQADGVGSNPIIRSKSSRDEVKLALVGQPFL